jgi:uncharacterized iron-regulated membrane protein
VATTNSSTVRKPWPDYRAVWRWHFYAGLVSIPFVVVLSITGAIYLFRPQVEPWTERAYRDLALTGPPASPAAHVNAALSAVPGATLFAYELPPADDAAARVIVTQQDQQVRVFLHPETLQVLHIVRDDRRLMEVISALHGKLLMGDWGSGIVELAASWAIVMIITGLYLWWPRQGRGLAGIAYPRLNAGQRVFWRDLHAVTGVWISSFALFLLLTGLPWAKVWGDYFKEVRRLTGTAVAKQDWPSGTASARAKSLAADAAMNATGTHAEHMATLPGGISDYAAIDMMVAAVRPLNLASPVLISPPKKGVSEWTAKSDAQNRPLRVNLVLDGSTGAILKRENFQDRHVIDRIVGIGIAAHEGQLFGWPNQLLGVLTAIGLILLSVSSVMMWWRRRPDGMLGAPEALQPSRFSFGLGLIILALAVYLPLLGLSMLVVKLIEKLILSRIPSVRNWLGLNPAAAPT